MPLTAIYARLKRQEITEEEAAEQFGISVRDLRFRITKYGNRLEKTLKVLDQINAGTVTRDQAAEKLGVSVRQVNNLQQSWHVRRIMPIKDYLIDRAVSKVKWEIRKNYAIEYIAEAMTKDEAAEHAQVSPRQLLRWVAELLEKHHQMTIRELRKLPLARRRRLAEQIEDAEGLDLAKQRVLREIAMGEKALKEVALERIANRRTMKDKVSVRGIAGNPPDRT